MRTGFADLPLHYGHCPPWLFQRMKRLGKEISEVIVIEFGKDEFLKRLSDPFFFQSFACVLGFDWHSSGVTTTVMGALKEGIVAEETGISVLGGKGKASKKTPEEIKNLDKAFNFSEQKIYELVYASKMSAKVDNAVVQDGYQLYHHTFIVSEEGKWAVVQQGMSDKSRYARRYHWLSEKVIEFVKEPHAAICCDVTGKTLNMSANESEEARKISVDLVKEGQENLKRLILDMKHEIDLKNYKPLMDAHEFQPKNYEELVAIRGIGAKSLRALALLSSLVYGTEPSWRDPCKFAFSHGGKDGYPFPVDRKTYDKSIEILRTALDNAKLGNREKLEAIKRLKVFLPEGFE